jgi:hypothetical protein
VDVDDAGFWPVDETAINDGERLPISKLLKGGAQPQQLVFNQKRHHMCQLHFLFLSIGEAGNTLSLHQWRAIVTPVRSTPGEWQTKATGLPEL